MKKINTGLVLKTFDGESLKIEEKEQTLGMILSELLAQDRTNPTLGWVLGKKFATEKEVDLKAEDVVYVKKALEELKVNALYGGQIINILDGEDSQDASKKTK